jgi:hypothetical protein
VKENTVHLELEYHATTLEQAVELMRACEILDLHYTFESNDEHDCLIVNVWGVPSGATRKG